MAYTPIVNAFRLSGPEAGGQPDYADALMKGFNTAEAAVKPRSASEQLLGQMLMNKIRQPYAQNAQEDYETQRDYKRAMMQKALHPELTGETAQLFRLRDSLPSGQDRDRVDQIIARKAAGSAGTTVFDPSTGNPLVQIGGQGGKSGGGTFINPATGEITSQPTGGTTTNLQGRVVGAEALKPYLEKVVDTLPQFQNPLTKASGYGQKISNAILGTDFPLPSEEAAGKAAIKEASEGMIKTFGLNATGANRHAMEQILKPRFGESPEGYASRVREQAEAYAKNQELAKSSLRGGIKLNPEQPTIKNVIGVPAGKIRVFFPDGPHVIPKKLLQDAIKAGATLEQEINPNGRY